MTAKEPARQGFKESYTDYVENPQYREQLEKWYQKEKVNRKRIIQLCLVVLCMSSFGQFAILDYSFGERLALSDSDRIFGFPIKALLSLLVTAALPITTLVDESEIIGQKIKISLFRIQFSPITWIVLPGDMLLTFQAILVGNQNAKNPDDFLPTIAFVLAVLFSTLAFYLSKAIVAAAMKYMKACKNLQIIRVYGINPIPFYKDAEQIKLKEENEAAKMEAEQARKKLEEETIKYKDELENQKIEYETKLRSHQSEQSEELQKREQELKRYKDYVDSFNQLKSNFQKIKNPIVNLISQGKEMFEKFHQLDESIKNFSFPKIEISSAVNSQTVERPTYYWKWQNSDHSWQDLQLPSELSPVGCRLLSAMEQQKELPVPNVRNYAPIEELSKCLVLGFEPYSVIVYCRDEEYRKGGGKWDAQAQLDFKRKLADDQIYGYWILEFTAQEIMSNPLEVLEQIKNAINSKMGMEPN
jgi:hypothetical protein